MCKKLAGILLAYLLIISTVVHAENSECDGKFENGQPVHATIDWSRSSVNVNGGVFRKFVVEHDARGISTDSFFSKFYVGWIYYKVINDINNGDMIFQLTVPQSNNGFRTDVLHWAKLSCSKSFIKPFMSRMIR